MQTQSTPAPPVVLVCQTDRLGVQAQCCGKRGAAAVLAALRAAVAAEGLAVSIEESPCLGHCSVGPNARLVGDSLHHHLTPETLAPLLERLRALAPVDDGGDAPSRPAKEMLPPV